MTSRPKSISINQPKQVLVEGLDDERLFGAFLKHLGVTDVQIHQYSGKENLGNFLKAYVRTPGFEVCSAIGIVRDADLDNNSAFQSIRTCLGNAGLAQPSEPLRQAPGPPSVTILVLPHGSNQGALEDVCLDAVSKDPATPCVEKYFMCLRHQKLLPVPQSHSKAKAYAFLSSRERPGLRIGEAAEAGYWPLDHAAFSVIRQFLGML